MNKPSVPSGFLPTNMNVTAGTQVHTGRGVLGTLVVNKVVASGTITVYDGTSTAGTKLGTITFPASPLSDVLQLWPQWNYYTGLFVVTTGAGIDVTTGHRPE